MMVAECDMKGCSSAGSNKILGPYHKDLHVEELTDFWYVQNKDAFDDDHICGLYVLCLARAGVGVEVIDGHLYRPHCLHQLRPF